jgi:HTH-type transcriptional regulator / antitoxin HigA
MKPKIIKTEAEHAEALARIEKIFEAEPGTPEGDELELLTMLVERYEDETYPMDLPDPVSAIKFRMEQQGLKNKDLIPFIGSPSKVSEVLSGQRGLSLTMIRSLVQGLGIPAEVLVGKPGAKLKPETDVAECRKYPIAEMVKRGWFTGFSGTVSEAKGQLEDLFDGFLSVLGGKKLRLAFNRQHIRNGGEHDDYALAAWRVRAVGLAAKESLPPYSQGTVTRDFLTELARLSYLDSGPKLAREFLNKSGIHLVFERHLPKTHLDGATLRLPDGSPAVALTLRYDRLDNFWFTLFHELAHVALHLDKDDCEAFFDDLNNVGTDRCEQQADAFASEALIPADKWKAARLNRKSTPLAVRQFADSLRISEAIPAGRIRFEADDYTVFKKQIGMGKVRRLFESGGD